MTQPAPQAGKLSLAGAGQDSHRQAVAGVELIERVGYSSSDRGIDRISLLGTV
jgi:hypothetical protein